MNINFDVSKEQIESPQSVSPGKSQNNQLAFLIPIFLEPEEPTSGDISDIQARARQLFASPSNKGNSPNESRKLGDNLLLSSSESNHSKVSPFPNESEELGDDQESGDNLWLSSSESNNSKALSSNNSKEPDESFLSSSKSSNSKDQALVISQLVKRRKVLNIPKPDQMPPHQSEEQAEQKENLFSQKFFAKEFFSPSKSAKSRDSLLPSSPESGYSPIIIRRRIFNIPKPDKMSPPRNEKQAEQEHNLPFLEHLAASILSYSSPKKKDQKDKLVISSGVCESPPSAQKIRCVLPSAPSSRQKKSSALPDELFSGPLDSSIDLSLSSVKKNSFFNPKKVYELDGQPHNLVQQAGKKSCGAATLLMLYTDIVRTKSIAFELSEDFWAWYGTCNLANRDDLCRCAKDYSNLAANKLRLSIQPLPSQDGEINCDAIQLTLQKTGLPVIVSITHPIIEGHWILIDAIQGQDVYMRDPAKGIAHKITREELGEYLKEGIECLLYVNSSRE